MKFWASEDSYFPSFERRRKDESASARVVGSAATKKAVGSRNSGVVRLDGRSVRPSEKSTYRRRWRWRCDLQEREGGNCARGSYPILLTPACLHDGDDRNQARFCTVENWRANSWFVYVEHKNSHKGSSLIIPYILQCWQIAAGILTLEAR